MQINQTNLKNFREDLRQALKALEEKYEVKVEQGSISYDNDKFNLKLTVKNLDADENRLQDLLNRNSVYRDIYQKTFREGTHTFTVVDFDSKSRKYDIICKRDDGKSFGFTLAGVLRALQK